MRGACAAAVCFTSVITGRYFCARHWRMVPFGLKLKLLEHYESGQAHRPLPPREWRLAMSEVVRVIREIESPERRVRV